MTKPNYLVTGAGGGVGGVSRQVVDRLLAAGQQVRAMVHREDDRAETLRGLGAAVQIRPTVFLENPLFTVLAAQSIRDHGVLALPFGTGRTSPIAASDVAGTVAAVLLDPAQHVGAVYELTGPTVLDIDGLAEQYSRALGRSITAERVDFEDWLSNLINIGLEPHVRQHISTMAKLHREDRYNRSTDQVQQLTGHAPQSVEDFVRAHRDMFTSAVR
jgi:uncharacterized protein YbjT (DUF2867 family)